MNRQLRERTIYTAGCPLHYWLSEDGDGPWLLFVHGAGVDHNTFHHQLPAVPPLFRLLLPDLRGHGKSRPMGEQYSMELVVKDILAVMEHAGCAKAVVVSQSMGGNVAQELVYHHPEKVAGLVFIGCSCNSLRLSLWEKAAARLMPLILSHYPWPSMIRHSAWIGCLKPAGREYLRRCFKHLSKQEFVRVFSTAFNCLRPQPGYKIAHKTLLLYGDHDYIAKITRVGRRWAQRDPDCQLFEIPAARHCAHLDNPVAVNKYLVDYLVRQVT